jgi:hypothetical protein
VKIHSANIKIQQSKLISVAEGISFYATWIICLSLGIVPLPINQGYHWVWQFIPIISEFWTFSRNTTSLKPIILYLKIKENHKQKQINHRSLSGRLQIHLLKVQQKITWIQVNLVSCIWYSMCNLSCGFYLPQCDESWIVGNGFSDQLCTFSFSLLICKKCQRELIFRKQNKSDMQCIQIVARGVKLATTNCQLQ